MPCSFAIDGENLEAIDDHIAVSAFVGNGDAGFRAGIESESAQGDGDAIYQGRFPLVDP